MTEKNRKETVEKILALLNGLSYGNAIQILYDVKETLLNAPLFTSSNNFSWTAFAGYSSSSPLEPNAGLGAAQAAQRRYETCPGRFARYSAIQMELTGEPLPHS